MGRKLQICFQIMIWVEYETVLLSRTLLLEMSRRPISCETIAWSKAQIPLGYIMVKPSARGLVACDRNQASDG